MALPHEFSHKLQSTLHILNARLTDKERAILCDVLDQDKNDDLLQLVAEDLPPTDEDEAQAQMSIGRAQRIVANTLFKVLRACVDATIQEADPEEVVTVKANQLCEIFSGIVTLQYLLQRPTKAPRPEHLWVGMALVLDEIEQENSHASVALRYGKPKPREGLEELKEAHDLVLIDLEV